MRENSVGARLLPGLIWGLAASIVACRPAVGPEPAAPPAVAPVEEASGACELPDTALAWVRDGEDCGLALVAGPSPRLIELRGERTWPVTLPSACADVTCDFALAETLLGPLIVAARRSPSGETPSWVGLGIELGGVFRFVDLWIGEGVLDELTPAGPVHALAPHDCEGRLALLVVPRLGGAAAEEVEPALRAAAGWVRLDGDDVAVDPVASKDCHPLDVPLP